MTPPNQTDFPEFPQQIWVDSTTGDLYLIQSEKSSDEKYESLIVSHFRNFAFVSRMTGLRGKSWPFSMKREGGTVFLTYFYQHLSNSTADRGWVRVPFVARKKWTKDEVLDRGTAAIQERPPAPPDWLQGEVETARTLYRLVGGPVRQGSAGGGPAAKVQFIRNRAVLDAANADLLGRIPLTSSGEPINGRLEPEGLAIADIKGAPHLLIGIANGRADNQSLQVNIYSWPLEWATVVSQKGVPSSMKVGESADVTVMMRNAGDTTWTPDHHHLRPVGETQWDEWGQHDLTSAVAPGATAAFTFPITAPSPGAGQLHWQMTREYQGQSYFYGQASPETAIAIIEHPPFNDALFLQSDGVPDALLVGSSAAVGIVMRNVGTTIWTTADGYRLGAVGYDFGSPRHDLPGPVQPFDEVRFAFTISAPPAPSGLFRWQMIQEGVGWFGWESDPIVIARVEAPQINDAQFVRFEGVPSGIPADLTASVSVVMRNTGTTTWTSAEAYRLGAVGHDFGTNRHDLSGPVAPGAEARFAFTIPAPPPPAATFQWQMVRDGHEWFGTPSNPVSVQRFEASECAGLRQLIKALQAQLESLSDELHRASPQERPAIVDEIQQVTADKNKATSRLVTLGCHR